MQLKWKADHDELQRGEGGCVGRLEVCGRGVDEVISTQYHVKRVYTRPGAWHHEPWCGITKLCDDLCSFPEAKVVCLEHYICTIGRSLSFATTRMIENAEQLRRTLHVEGR